MELVKCKKLGFCRGVHKTIDNAEKCIELAKQKNKNSYSIGSLVHNEDVVKEYRQKGLKVINAPEDVQPGVALIRAHGIPESKRRKFENAGFELIDSTCINICKSFNEIKKAAQEKRAIAVIGMKDHAETTALLGVTLDGKPIEKFLISSIEDASDFKEKVPENEPVSVVVQTTFAQNEYEHICRELMLTYTNIVFCTQLCRECIERKEQVLMLSEQCDAIVVIGSENSANTQDLVQIAKSTGKKVFAIANKSAISENDLKTIRSFNTVGVCSGTSVPLSVIDPVCSYLTGQ